MTGCDTSRTNTSASSLRQAWSSPSSICVTFTSDTLYALLELNGRSHGVAVVGEPDEDLPQRRGELHSAAPPFSMTLASCWALSAARATSSGGSVASR